VGLAGSYGWESGERPGLRVVGVGCAVAVVFEDLCARSREVLVIPQSLVVWSSDACGLMRSRLELDSVAHGSE
jgi:hypothetical protein